MGNPAMLLPSERRVVIQFTGSRRSSNGRAIRPPGYRDHMKQPRPPQNYGTTETRPSVKRNLR